MENLKVGLSDTVTAEVDVAPSVDTNGNLNFTGQIVLRDTTSGASAPVGNSFAIPLTPDQQAAVDMAVNTVLAPIVQAQLAPKA